MNSLSRADGRGDGEFLSEPLDPFYVSALKEKKRKRNRRKERERKRGDDMQAGRRHSGRQTRRQTDRYLFRNTARPRDKERETQTY